MNTPAPAYTDRELERALNKSKINLISHKNSTFITTILFGLKFHWADNVDTAGVDGVNLYVNPDFFMGLSPDQRQTLLAHEAWHPAFEHPVRGKSFEHKKYNIAADHVINNMLKDSGFAPISDWFCDPAYRGLSTEQVYNLLPDEPESEGDGEGDEPFMDIVYSEEDDEETAERIKTLIVKASVRSKMEDQAGSIPADIQRAIDDLLRPQLPWNTLLHKYTNGYAPDDYSYARMNKRYLPEWFLPTLYSEAFVELSTAIDTSGSVLDKELVAYVTEIDQIRRLLHPLKTTVIDFDYVIHNVHTLGEQDSLRNIEFEGGGGTSLTPVFEHIENQPTNPTVLIVFSDLCCEPMTEDPGYPVIWVCVNNPYGKVNFGHLIHMSI